MYEPRRAAGSLVVDEAVAPAVDAAFGRPRRAVRTWRDVVTDHTGPALMSLAAAATVGSIVLASNAAAVPAEAPLQSLTNTVDRTQQVNRSEVRVALVGDVPSVTVKRTQVVELQPTRTMYAKADLTVRAKADAAADKVSSLQAGAKLTVTPVTRNGFRLVQVKGKDAWVLDKSLSATKPKLAATASDGPAATRPVPGGSVLGLQPEAMVVYRAVMSRWAVPSVGGWRAHSLSVHQYGRAIDFMVYSDSKMGYAVRDFLVAHAKEFGVDHIIYRQQIWTPYSPYWRHMADRGSPTANHMDHVHVAVKNR
ncbi:MAG: hypothetical protein HZY73_14975 [Micropruina sp.]|nr:MAG: hypothetical protein HZY73_14975 [Micropruina sp.]